MSGTQLNVTFLGKAFTFPSDILSYLDDQVFFASLKEDLRLYLIKNYPAYPDFLIQSTINEEENYSKFYEYANSCVKRIISKEIYDVTVEDFIGKKPERVDWNTCAEIPTNPGIKYFFASLKDAAIENLKAEQEKILSIVSGMQSSESEIASKATRPSVGILTNSVVDYAAWALGDAIAAERQQRKADIEFSKAFTRIERENSDSMNKRLKNYCINVWLPGLNTTADLFITDLQNKYYQFLLEHGTYDPATFKHIDLDKAESILRNIDITIDKPSLIQSAFSICPFCISTYIHALSNTSDKEEVVQCARTMNTHHALESHLVNSCMRQAKLDVDSEARLLCKVKPYLDTLSILNDETALKVRDAVIKTYRGQKESHIKSIFEDILAQDDYQLKGIVRHITLASSDSATRIEKEKLKLLAKEYIEKEYFSKEDSLSFHNLIDEYSEKMANRLTSFFDHFFKNKLSYEDALKEYETYLPISEKELAAAEEEISSLGLFALSKKKLLRDSIQKIEDRLATLEKTYKQAEQKYKKITF